MLAGEKEVTEEGEANAVVSLVEGSSDSGSHQVKVRSIVTRTPEGLISGETATPVVDPGLKEPGCPSTQGTVWPGVPRAHCGAATPTTRLLSHGR